MRKIYSLTLIVMSLVLTANLHAQNLIDYWNGYDKNTGTYVTGEGSQAKYWGWSTVPATAEANWNVANGTSSIRYMDNVSGYDPGRIFYIRWDGVVSTSGKYYFKLDTINTTQLTGGNAYTFTWSYAWNSNASAPKITATVCAAKDGSGALTPLEVTGINTVISGSSAVFECATTAKSMRTGSLTFLVPTTGTYYISFGASTASLCAIRDLTLVDKGNSYAGLLELQKQTDALTLGDLSAVSSDITLPTTAGTQGVTIKWASDKPEIIDSVGHVVQPAKYNKVVNLTATLSMPFNDTIYTSTKTFTAIVLGVIPTPMEVAQWNFKSDAITFDNGVVHVADTKSGFTGTMKNEARVRTIGTTQQFNVLDLGNGTGYFDMGTDIGQAIYSLTDYTMCGYFRIDDTYPYLNNNGNFYWTFSNSPDIDADRNGYIIASLKAQGVSVANYYNINNTATNVGSNAPKGAWHHFAFVQNGKTGTVYVDGTQVAQNVAMSNLPAFLLPKPGLVGTNYNWLGRSNYKNDVYLRQTLLYDFRVFSIPLSETDLNWDVVNVSETLGLLNTAYGENPDYIANELITERDNLNPGDLSAVTSNLSLPVIGTIDPAISISWKSFSGLVAADGTVTRPDYFNYTDTLTATLFKNGQFVTRKFPVTIVANAGTAFTSDLLVKYDFSQLASDSIVTDVAEKHFQGVARNNATVETMGQTTKYNVLNLGDSIGYFDMGTEMGKLMYHLEDYTISAYYRVDTAYHQITNAGNFLWNIANSKDMMGSPTGAIIMKLNDQAYSITPKNYTSHQSLAFGQPALPGGWHNLTYTQAGNTGTLYLDGMPLVSDTITYLPINTLRTKGQIGTLYNWLGRSSYLSDVYLRNTLVYDFRLYKRALTEAEITNTELNVGNTIAALDKAYDEGLTGLADIRESGYRVATSGGEIRITGLAGTERVTLYDVTGRQLNMKNARTSTFKVGTGIYIVRINNFATKVIVK